MKSVAKKRPTNKKRAEQPVSEEIRRAAERARLLAADGKEKSPPFGELGKLAKTGPCPHGLDALLKIAAEFDRVGGPIPQAVAVALCCVVTVALTATTGFEYRAQLGILMSSIAHEGFHARMDAAFADEGAS